MIMASEQFFSQRQIRVENQSETRLCAMAAVSAADAQERAGGNRRQADFCGNDIGGGPAPDIEPRHRETLLNREAEGRE
jgi:hypothetical protein